VSSRDETFARLDAIQRQSAERLQSADAGGNRELLVELLEASCLLELAKIEATRLDPVSYLQLAVDVIAQMYPVEGVAATVTQAGMRAIDVYAGERSGGGRRSPLVSGATTIGVLVTGAMKADLGAPDEFFDRAATQMSAGLATAMHAEQLRRDAATATAARVASELSDESLVENLEELALALASFPAVIAAEVAIDHPATGPLLRLKSGYWDSDGEPHSIESVTLDLEGKGRLTVRLRSVDDSPPDGQAVHDVLQRLAASFDRIAHTDSLREQAETDALTNVGNRRRLQRVLEQALGRAGRYGEHVAVLLLDLDKFKPVNDELGHETGDAVIVACAHALNARTRVYDEVIRLGGDEFVIVAPVPDVLDALRLADDLREEIARACNALLPAGWGLTATIGVAVYPEAANEPESLLRAADVALYKAKDAGRDGVMVAEPVIAEAGPAPRSFLSSPEE
jgi:diguanylate cyclase (GGDEF)-like protein